VKENTSKVVVTPKKNEKKEIKMCKSSSNLSPSLLPSKAVVEIKNDNINI